MSSRAGECSESVSRIRSATSSANGSPSSHSTTAEESRTITWSRVRRGPPRPLIPSGFGVRKTPLALTTPAWWVSASLGATRLRHSLTATALPSQLGPLSGGAAHREHYGSVSYACTKHRFMRSTCQYPSRRIARMPGPPLMAEEWVTVGSWSSSHSGVHSHDAPVSFSWRSL